MSGVTGLGARSFSRAQGRLKVAAAPWAAGLHRCVPHWAVLERALLLGCSSLLAVTAVSGMTAGPAAASVDQVSTGSTSSTTQELCQAPALEHLRCLGVRRTDVSEPSGLSGSSDVVAPAAAPAGYGPAELVSAYNLDTTGGSGRTVAVVDAYDNPSAEAELAVYRAHGSATSSTTGIARFPLTAGGAGTYTYRMRVTGDARGSDGVSPNLLVTVR
jgi:hypothetical protein